MRRVFAVLGVTVVVAVLLWWSLRAFGARSTWFAFLVVWLPMTWLGTLSHVIAVRLPDRFHELRHWERDGRVYEAMGVRVVKWLLRRGPMAVFNPALRLPAEHTPVALGKLDRAMIEAEASHAILFVASLAVAFHTAARGWWVAAWWTALFDVLVNGYPVMLQRYNRALLRRRFPDRMWSGH